MKNINNYKITITGASGLIGRNIVKYLLENYKCNLTVTYLSKKEIPKDVKLSKRCHIIVGDLSKISKCKEVLRNTDVLIHLAQSVNPKQYSQDFDKSILFNLEPTFNIFNLLSKSKRKIHLIFPSSGGTVYGKDNGNCLETEQNVPISPYGIQKLMLEKYINLIYEQNKNITANILRISNPYGSLLSQARGQGFIGIAIDNILKGLPVEIWDDINSVRDYIYTDDLCKALVSSIKYRNKVEIFNIGSGKGTSLKKIMSILKSYYGNNVKYKILNQNNIFSAKKNILNIKKAYNILKWKPEISVQNGIEKMIKNIK